jgi:hypothetical protein
MERACSAVPSHVWGTRSVVREAATTDERDAAIERERRIGAFRPFPWEWPIPGVATERPPGTR